MFAIARLPQTSLPPTKIDPARSLPSIVYTSSRGSPFVLPVIWSGDNTREKVPCFKIKVRTVNFTSTGKIWNEGANRWTGVVDWENKIFEKSLLLWCGISWKMADGRRRSGWSRTRQIFPAFRLNTTQSSLLMLSFNKAFWAYCQHLTTSSYFSEIKDQRKLIVCATPLWLTAKTSATDAGFITQ